MAARTDQTPDDPVLGLIAKRKAEALARAEKEHNQLAAAAKLWAQGTKAVTDAEENLRKGREKQDSAIASMVDVGMAPAQVADTLGITPKAVTEALKRHKAASGDPTAAPAKAPAKKAAGRPRKDAETAEPEAKEDGPSSERPAAPVPADAVADAAPEVPAVEAAPDPTDGSPSEASDAA